MKSRAQVAFEIEGLGAERLLNEARRKGIAVSGLRRGRQRRMQLRCSPADYEQLKALGEEKGYAVSAPLPVGWYRLWRQIRGRWGLWVGLGLALGMMIWALGFIWEIRIENAGVYRGEVALFLEEKGVRAGLRRQMVDPAALQRELEWRLPAVKWVQVAYRGAALEIRLESGTPPPEILSHQGSGDVVAAEDGLLLRLIVFSGTPAVEPGEMVKKGQVLIRGAERGRDGEWVPVQARGQALARLWVCAQVQMPLREIRSIPTGKSYERWGVQTPFGYAAFAQTPDYLAWDLEAWEQKIGSVWLPVSVRHERYLEVAQEWEVRNEEAVRQEAAKGALLLLQKALPHENIIDKWIDFRMIEGDTIAATATAEIHRDIGRCEKN